MTLALRTLEGERGPAVFATLLRVFGEMDRRQRVFYTETKAFAPRDKALRAQRDTAAVAAATLTEPAEQPAGGATARTTANAAAVLARETGTTDQRATP